MREVLLLALLSFLLGLGCVGVLVWAILTGNVRGLDGILLVLSSLLLAVVFFGVGYSLLQTTSARGLLQPRSTGSSHGAKQSPPKPPEAN